MGGLAKEARRLNGKEEAWMLTVGHGKDVVWGVNTTVSIYSSWQKSG